MVKKKKTTHIRIYKLNLKKLSSHSKKQRVEFSISFLKPRSKGKQVWNVYCVKAEKYLQFDPKHSTFFFFFSFLSIRGLVLPIYN